MRLPRGERREERRVDGSGGTDCHRALIVVVLLLILMMLVRMFRKVGPNEALIVYGFGGTRIVQGSGTIVWQWCRVARAFAGVDVLRRAPQGPLHSAGRAVTVEAVAQIKVKSDPRASGRRQSSSSARNPKSGGADPARHGGSLRGIVGQLTVEQIVKEPEMVGGKMRSTCADDLSKMGWSGFLHH